MFAKQFQSDGHESAINPTVAVDEGLDDGVVADKAFIERLEPASQHSQEVMDEDDAFLGHAAPEVWEYGILDGKENEFVDAMRSSRVVMDYEVIDESSTEPGDVSSVELASGDANASEETTDRLDVTRGGSGVSGVDEGPGGQVTGDPSAGGSSPAGASFGLDEVSGIADKGSGELDELTVKDANDPSLGLTNHGVIPPQDWAADTGPSRVADRGIETDFVTDKASTLGPDKTTKRAPRKRAPRKSKKIG